MKTLVLIVVGIGLPILLFPVEFFLPYPFIVEELAKLGALYWLGTSSYGLSGGSKKTGVTLAGAVLLGGMFTVSESMLYTMNLWSLGQLSVFPQRLVMTGLLHVFTTLLIWVGLEQKRTIIKLAFLVSAMVVHFVYNAVVGTYGGYASTGAL